MIDIKSNKGYPSSELSNFAEHKFIIDDINCASMEGFLQSLKYKEENLQRFVCTLTGKKAKSAGKSAPDWKKTQTLWWKGISYPRYSEAYQLLLNRVFNELLQQNKEFKQALLDTGTEELTHSIGKKDSRETILTEDEFCSRLTKMRKQLRII